ncbi:EamA family transporter [Chloroflexus sp.]|uniref:EamA family transporter n=1 Tax=Chloroflexus sp. TaxID=1904827 RepID=UPI002ACDE933|nr:EamA family transporter [Chloroflexus sp.]
MSTIMLILIATALGVIGQMMLKQGMGAMGPLALTLDATPSIILRIVTSPMVIGGLLIYGIGTFFWLITLSRIELSVAYPFVSLNHIIIFLLAWLVLHEQVNPLRAAGVLVICAGMLMVARS